MSERIKKWLKVIGIIVGALLLYGIFNLFFGGVYRQTTLNYKEGQDESAQSLNSPGAIKNMGSSISKSDSVSAPAMERSTAGVLAESEEMLGEDEETQDKRVIKNGNLSLKVEKTEEAAKKISEFAKFRGGEVFSSRFYERVKGSKSGTMTVKVPVDKFEETMEEIKKAATQVISESTTGKDVTEQYTDLQAQLKNKRAEEETFVKILDRSGKIEDVLKVTKEISRVRGEIERLEGRIKYLESQTDMSTITVSLSEDIEITPVGEGWRPWQVVKNSVKTLIKNAQGSVDNLIYFVIVKIPSIIVFFLILWMAYRIMKIVYRKIKA